MLFSDDWLQSQLHFVLQFHSFVYKFQIDHSKSPFVAFRLDLIGITICLILELLRLSLETIPAFLAAPLPHR